MGTAWNSLLVTVLMTTCTVGLQAQDAIPAGVRVRLAIKAPRVSPLAPDTHTVALKGRALSADGGALLVERESTLDTLSVSLDSVRILEAVAGWRHPVREGTVVGALAGAGIGAAVGVTVDQCPNAEFMCFNARPVRSRGLGAVIGALIGAGAGWLIAQSLEVDRWQRIEPKRVRVALVPAGRGGTLGATIAF
jgi:hypothetical protein